MSDAYFGNGGGNALPSAQGDKANIWREIRKLWKTVGEQQKRRPNELNEVIWTPYGTIDVESVPQGQWRWVAPYDCTITSIAVTAGVGYEHYFRLWANGYPVGKDVYTVFCERTIPVYADATYQINYDLDQGWEVFPQWGQDPWIDSLYFVGYALAMRYEPRAKR